MKNNPTNADVRGLIEYILNDYPEEPVLVSAIEPLKKLINVAERVEALEELKTTAFEQLDERDKLYDLELSKVSKVFDEMTEKNSVLEADFTDIVKRHSDYMNRNVELQKELAALKKANEWQPIESVPKDKIIEVLNASGKIFKARYDFTYDHPMKGKQKGALVFKEVGVGCSYNIQPNHWRPIPDYEGG